MSFLHHEHDGASGESGESAGRSPGRSSLSEGLPVQRKAPSAVAGGGSPSFPVGDDPFSLHLESPAPVQRKATGAPEAAPVADAGGASNGIPLPVQRKMETAFGSDFSDVNIHTGSSEATGMGALAYTQGTDIHFAPGQYDPHSHGGQELLGHELAHVVQQREGRVDATHEIRGKGINDDDALEREADVQGALAAAGQPANSAGAAASAPNGSIQRKVVQRRAGVIQMKGSDSSFPEELTDEDVLAQKDGGEGAQGPKPGGKKPVQAKRAGGPLQLRAARPVIQMRGGTKVGRLSVVSSVAGGGLTDGHAWLSYTPTGGSETTYGTWGNRTPYGLHRDLEVGRGFAARRSTDVDAVDVGRLDSFASSNNSWGYTNNCASFAARGWLSVTGESISYTSYGIPNPSALGTGILAKGGELGTGGPSGSSNSSGSSFGSSSVGSVGPGSSGG